MHEIRLRLHPWQVMPTRAGVGLVGFRVQPDQVRVRRSTVARTERRLRRQRGSEDFQRRMGRNVRALGVR